MESVRLRKLVFGLFFILIPFSCTVHWPGVTGSAAEIMQWAGAIILAITVPLSIYLHSLFPKRHDRPQDFGKLLTEGPYRYMRHPFYSTFIFMGFGIALFWVSIPGIVAYTLMIPLWERLAELEEKELLEYWGDEYKRFMETRARFLPKLNKTVQQKARKNENL